VIVWLWQAGTAEGVIVAGDQQQARTRVAAFIRRTGMVAAVMEMAYFDDGVKSLSAGYVSADAWRSVARCHPSGRISWSIVPAKPEVAA
jgi:hypothetical protein